VIADLIRAFVEAVVVRELTPRLAADFDAMPGARVTAIHASGTGALYISWETP
jgi:hypothetical protein